ncbi:MAG: flagellar export chaperone FliS [Burkholderiales bacterium]|nr:flagellar export chaperone FliS [Burkholderiales bacterium]
MVTKLKNALSAYGRDRLEHEVDSASPHKLVCMLFDGMLAYISRAKMFMQQGQIADKGMTISNAIAVIEQGLRPSLDIERSGELGANLDALYDYMLRRLLYANLHNDVAALDEVHGLVSQLREAWNAIEQPRPATAVADDAQIAERKPLSYGRV